MKAEPCISNVFLTVSLKVAHYLYIRASIFYTVLLKVIQYLYIKLSVFSYVGVGII